MSVRLWPVLPKDFDRNGLGTIEQQITDDTEATFVIVAVVNQRRVTSDADTGENTPVARVLHVESLVTPEFEKQGRELLVSAHKDRTGRDQLDYPDGGADDDD